MRCFVIILVISHQEFQGINRNTSFGLATQKHGVCYEDIEMYVAWPLSLETYNQVN